MPDVARHIFSFILKFGLGLFAAIFALSLLFATLVVLVLSRIKALITGRKPAPFVPFGRFQQFSPQGAGSGPGRRASARGTDSGQVVDVEAREIREDKHLH